MELAYNQSEDVLCLYEDNENYYKPDKKLRIQLDGIVKRLFSLKNKIPIIDFLNAAYGDNISYDAKITYGDKEFSRINKSTRVIVNFFADMYINVDNGDKIYEYEIEFQTKYEKGLIIRMFRYGFERAVKLLDYNDYPNDIIEINVPEPYIIVIEEKEKTPDKLQLKINFPKSYSFTYSCNVFKYYEKDVEDLRDNNMYLLLPLSIVKIRK